MYVYSPGEESQLIELNSTFRIMFSYYRGHIVVVLRAGWDSIRATLSWQSLCFKCWLYIGHDGYDAIM